MERIPTSPPAIKPLPTSAIRPLWSVMIPVYNCANFLEGTLLSVLSQALPTSKMQIEVIDDASTDADVEAIVRRVGKGKVRYYRQPRNVGSLRNFETCINRAQGHLVHILHGDDRVLNGYYATIQSLFKEYPEAGAAFCGHQVIDEAGKVMRISSSEMPTNGLLDGWLLRIATRQRIQYVTVTVKREVYEHLGSFYGRTYGEDWEMWVRIAKHYPVAYTPDILAEYRKHHSSISSKKILTGEYLKDLACLIEIIGTHVPQQQQKRVLKAARRNYAHYGIYIADDVWRTTQNKKAVMVSIRNSLSLHSDLKVYFRAAKLIIKTLLSRRKQK